MIDELLDKISETGGIGIPTKQSIQEYQLAKSQLKDMILKEILIMPECNCKHARSILKEQRTKLNELFEGKK